MDGLLDLRLLDWTAVCWFVYHKRAPFSRQIKVRRPSFVEFEGPAKPTDAALDVAATKAAAVTANRRDTVGRTPVSAAKPYNGNGKMTAARLDVRVALADSCADLWPESARFLTELKCQGRRHHCRRSSGLVTLVGSGPPGFVLVSMAAVPC